MTRAWTEFPYDADQYRYPGKALEKRWARLHEGDREPFPSESWVKAMDADTGVLEGRSAAEVAEALCEAWRDYHCGRFAAAAAAGDKLGPLGSYVTNKATGIYAVYLERDEKLKLDLYREVADRAEQAAELLPDHANSHYFHAFALGRYSQGISIAKALRKGLGGKVKDSLHRALELEPKHADAHTALGLYHAEILDKIGAMIGALTYGASAEEALEHFELAIELAPHSAIARVEFANGLLMLEGDKAYDRASELYVQASEMTPVDAMERLDVELALSELE